jgi:hypothetical protein
MTILSGNEFNALYPNTEFYKVLTKDYKHYDFTYQHGLNVDHIPFNTSGICSLGGLYFTEVDKVSYWIDRFKSVYIAKVTIPSNASVYVEKDKFKADQFILDLDNKVLIKDFYMWENEEFCKNSVSQADTYNLVFVRNQPDEICKLAVKHDYRALEYVINQTDDICKIAVSNHGFALEFVKDQTDDICKMAVKNGYGLEFVKVQTDEICKIALIKNGRALRYVILQTDELCKLAVSQNGHALEFVKVQTGELCQLAVSQNAHALKYVINQTDDICQLAVSKNPFVLEYVKVQTDELCQLAVSHNDGDTFAFYIPT